jgi:DNA-binding IclR family transcriptional regulator
MAKRKPKLPPLTPRAREVVTAVVNSVALGTHDDDAEVGALAKQLGSTPARLQTILHKLESQGWVTVKSDFVYPTAAALRWQNPDLDEREADKVLRRLK